MARITVEDCLLKEPNRFALVLLAAKRTKQLFSGATSTLTGVKNRPVVTALREIAAGNVCFMTDEDMAHFHERQKAIREARLSERPVESQEERAKAEALMSAEDLFINLAKSSQEEGGGEGYGAQDDEDGEESE